MKWKMNEFEWAAWMFVLIGAIHLGFIGIFNFDLVGAVLSTSPVLVRILYALIGFSASYWLYRTITDKK